MKLSIEEANKVGQVFVAMQQMQFGKVAELIGMGEEMIGSLAWPEFMDILNVRLADWLRERGALPPLGREN